MARRKKAEQLSEFFPADRPVLVVDSPADIKAASQIVGQRYSVCCMGQDIRVLFGNAVILWPANTPESITKMEAAAKAMADQCLVKRMDVADCEPGFSASTCNFTWPEFSRWAKDRIKCP